MDQNLTIRLISLVEYPQWKMMKLELLVQGLQ